MSEQAVRAERLAEIEKEIVTLKLLVFLIDELGEDLSECLLEFCFNSQTCRREKRLEDIIDWFDQQQLIYDFSNLLAQLQAKAQELGFALEDLISAQLTQHD